MFNFTWHFRAARKTFNQKGIKYFIQKVLRHLYLIFRRVGEDQWWNSTKRRSEAFEHLRTFSSADSKESSSVSEALMNRAFVQNLQLKQGLPGEYITEFLRATERRQAYRDYRSTVQDELLHLTFGLDPLCLPCEKWFLLQYLCIRNGFFKTAFFVRQKAVEKAYRVAESAYPETAFRAGIDQADFQNSQAFLNEIKRLASPEFFNERDRYYALNTGNLEYFQKIQKKGFTRIERRFLEFVKGKSVAIVGPAPSGNGNGYEIDSFDLVIRINYRGMDNIPDWNEFGKKTNISYYNMNFIKSISRSEKDFFKELEFSVFKKIDYKIQEDLVKSHNGRVWKQNELFFNGSSLTGIVAIFDLLHFCPAFVKVFNINFYLSHIPYYAGYLSGVQGAFIDDKFTNYFDNFNFSSFAEHDIISNINFTRNLWKAGLIEVDDALKPVLKLTTSEYLNALESLFYAGSLRQV